MTHVMDDIRDYYIRIENCVNDVVLSDPIAGEREIQMECTGRNYSILHSIFEEKLKILSFYYEWSLLE